jgi:hypothetical protein
MRLLLLFAAMPVLVVALLDLYPAVTGRRVSKKPSRRTDAEMRRQSAIAGVVLMVCFVAVLVLASAA